MRLALLCATSVILKIIELANCTRSQAVIDEGLGFLSRLRTCSQNVAPLSYRLIGQQQIQESWGERSRIVPVTIPEVQGHPSARHGVFEKTLLLNVDIFEDSFGL